MTVKKNRYAEVPINIIYKPSDKDFPTVMRNIYKVILNSKANDS